MNFHYRTTSDKDFYYRVPYDNLKLIELTFKGESLQFELKVKRAFTVLKALVEHYPEYMNIHSLDGTLNDPNRALSSLRKEDGFQHFLLEERQNNVVHVKLDVSKLFSTVSKKSEVIRLWPHDNRENIPPAIRRQIFKNFCGKCNITGIGLKKENEFSSVVFMKNAMSSTYDHRKPLSRGGSNQKHNFQLLSKLANDEKNKICNACSDPQCEMCALAHPERVKVIYPTGQDISNLRRNGK